MDRSGVRRSLRGISPLVIVVTALALVAGGVTAVVMPGGSHPGLSIQAAGSSGSLRHYSWWDPRGWFGGDGAPSSHAVPGAQAAVPYPVRKLHPAKAAPERRVREVTSKRTEFSRSYLLSDGKTQAVVSAGPVNYRDAAGKWQPISTTVEPSAKAGFRYQNVSNVFQSFFGATASQLVRFDAPGGGWVSIGLAAGTVRSPLVSGGTVTYPDVLPGVTLSYEVTAQSLKERISLASAAAGAALPSLPFVIKTGGGLKAAAKRDGSIAVMRGAVPVLTLPKPFMTDARAQVASSSLGAGWTTKVAQHATSQAGGTIRLTVSADAAWLAQPGRKFPVIVDPTIAISPTPDTAQNTTIYSANPSANFSGIWQLDAGTDSAGAYRSLLSFPLSTLPNGTQLQSANLRLYEDLPFGPGTATQTVQAYQATKAWTASTATWANASSNIGQLGASVAVAPVDANGNGVNNTWDSFSVANIVQSWLDTPGTNDGFVVKAADESTLNVGGPVYEGSSGDYAGETATFPQLVLTYGTPGVVQNPITTIHGTGAELSWTAYTNSTSDQGKNLADYQVYRGTSQSFTPDESTLVASLPDATTTSFTDTTATPSTPGSTANTVYYMIAVRTQDGTVIPGTTQLAQLPTAGSTTQIIDAAGATTLSAGFPDTSMQPYNNGELPVGNDSLFWSTTRAVMTFPPMASAGIPADASVTGATLRLWGYYNDNSAGALYEVHPLTQATDPSTATWNSASSSTAWTTPGGSFGAAEPEDLVGFSQLPQDADWPDITATVQDWVDTPADEDGLLVKQADENNGPLETEYFLDTTATEPALRPQLRITYTEPTAADTYYVPQLPSSLDSAQTYTVPVTLTNTTSDTWAAADWVLSYHWLMPDGTDVSDPGDQMQTALPADMPPGAVTTVNATMIAADTSGTGDDRNGMQLAWDLYDKTTGTWLSSGTSTPGLTSAGAVRLGSATSAGSGAARAGAPGAGAMPMAQGNHTVPVLKQAASVQVPSSDKLGLEKFYQYTGIATGSGTSIQNNAYAGNAVWNYNAFSNPSRGFQTFVRMSYNSLDTSNSSMGFGWSLQASTLQRLGTPLNFLPNPNPTTVKLTDGDGTSHLFTWNANATPPQWVSPPGVHYFLQQNPNVTCDPNGKTQNPRAWSMTAPDRTVFWFDCQGYQSAVIDKNGNEADFFYTQRNSNNQPVKFLSYITDPTGRQTLTLRYYQMGDTYNFIDGNGNVATATNLTDPDIINQVKSITDVSGRTVTFLYTVQGLMAQMTDGDGTAAAKTFKFVYDPTQGNKNVKLVSVTDPRGNATNLAYFTAPVDPKFKWSLQSVSDRLQHTTSFAYTQTGNGAIQTVVTDPKTNTTTYQIDATGRPTQITNAKNQVTNLVWDGDNNVISLTQPSGTPAAPTTAQTTWSYDPLTGYPLTTKDAQANHDGTAGTTYTYQTLLYGHVADLTSELTPAQRLWTFAYDNFGNLTSTTMPDGNVTNPTAPFTSKYTYDTFGDLLKSTDPDGNTTNYGPAYDPTGSPLSVTDPMGNTASYVYDLLGDVTSQTDPAQKTSTFTYDVFGRPTGSKVPQDQANGVYITTPPPVYDGNDNVLQSTAPNGAVTTTAFNADDEPSSQTLPPNSAAPAGPARTNTFTYDLDGNLLTATEPNGNVSGAAPGSFTTSYEYDAINDQTQVTDALGHQTKYAYDNAGNTMSVTDALTNQISYAYNLNNWPVQTTDAGQFTKSTGYDLDGNITSQTDENNSTTLYHIDPDGLMTQQQVPYTSSGGTVTYHTTQYQYDQDGNQTATITPRGVAAGVAGAFTAVTKYNADSQVSAQLGPFDPNDPLYNKAAETDYSYTPTGQVKTVTAPPSVGGGPNVISYDYFDNGWAKDAVSPWNVKTSYTYNQVGQQTSASLSAVDGTLTRGNSWTYFPDGSLATRSDAGIPSGTAVEEADNSDFNNATATPAAGAWTTQTSGTGFEGYNYATHAAGTGTDTFSWHLNIPADGTYAVYVKYPQVAGAATNASYQVAYNGGTSTATATADQTQNAGSWVKLGSWAFTQASAAQQVTLSENSGGTVSADAVMVVRDNGADTNTQNQTFSYSYDPSGDLTAITANGPAVTSTGYTVGYDQVNQVTGVTQQNAAGATIHTTTFGYDPTGDLTSQVNDGQTSTYRYDARGLLSTASVPASVTDNTQQNSTYTYTPTGLVATEAKPNGNTVSYGYYLDGNQQSQTETKAGGTLVSSHAYSYDQDGNQTQDVQKLMSADTSTDYLSHTLDTTYNPSDQVTQVTKDGTLNQQYAYDLDGNITSQMVNGASTQMAYDRNRLLTATTNGVQSNYSYDPLGRLDSITTAGALGSQYTYDGFDHVTAVRQYATGGTSSTTAYTYDPLDRQTSQTTNAGTGTAKTTDYQYLGLSNELIQESVGGTVTKSYGYSPWGERLSQDTYTNGTASTGYYSYDSHSNVEAVTGGDGNTMATYGYTAYGQDDTGQFTGMDKPGTQPAGAQPFNVYRFNADRSDGPGGYNMGFRDYSPVTARFMTPDGYDGALSGQGLVTDPFTGNPYGFGDGNPLSNIELDGHGWLSDLGHAALNVAGMVPVVGAVADAANAVWYAADGDYGDAALSAAGAIPVIGDAVLGGKLAVTGAKVVEDGVEGAEDASKAYRAAKGTAEGAEAVNDAAKLGEDAGNVEEDMAALKRAEQEGQRAAEQRALARAAKAAAAKQAEKAAAAREADAAATKAQEIAQQVPAEDGGGSFVDFAHGTTVASGRDIVASGLSQAKALGETLGAKAPGSFFTVRVNPADPEAAIETAAFWGSRQGSEVCVVICRLQSSVVDQLEGAKLLQHTDIPNQSVFSPGSFETVNKAAQWFIIGG